MCCATEAEALDLPVGKVNRLIAYGGLKYPNRNFFDFICRIEKCFASLLTNENLVIHGPSLNNTIMVYLQACLPLGKVLTEFLDEDDSCIEFSEVYNYVICTYARMRGKDITRCIIGQKRRSLSLHTCQKVAAVSDWKT